MSGTYKWPVFDQHDLIHPTRGQRIAESVLLDPTRKFYDESRSFKVKGSDNSTAPQPTYFQSEFELRMDATSTSTDETLKDLYLAYPGEPRNRGLINAPEIPSRRKQFVTSTGDFTYGHKPQPFVNNAFSYGSDINHIGNNYPPPPPATGMSRHPMFEPPPSLHRGIPPSLPPSRPKYERESMPVVPPPPPPKLEPSSVAEMDEKEIDGYEFYDTLTLDDNQIIEPNEPKNAPDGNPNTTFVTDTDNPTPKARTWYQLLIEPLIGRRAVEQVPSHESMIISPSLPEEKITAEAYKVVQQNKEVELREQIARLERELSQVQENAMNPEEAAVEIQRKIAVVQSQLEAAIKEREHLRSLVDSQAQTLDMLDKTMVNMEEKLQEKERNIQLLQNALRQAHGNQQEQLQRNLQERMNETEQLRQDLETIRQELVKEKEKVSMSDKSTSELQLQLLSSNQNVEALQEVLAERNVQNEELSSQTVRLAAQLAVVEAQLKTAEANLNDAQKKLAVGQQLPVKQLEELRQEVQKKTDRIDQLHGFIEQLEDQLEAVRNEEQRKKEAALQQQQAELQNHFNQQLLAQGENIKLATNSSVQSAIQQASEAQKNYSLAQDQLKQIQNDLENHQQTLRKVVKSVFDWNDAQFDQQWTTSNENVYKLLEDGVNNMGMQISARQEQRRIDSMISEISDRVGREKNELKQIYEKHPTKFFGYIVQLIQQDHESRISTEMESRITEMEEKTIAEQQKMLTNRKKIFEEETRKIVAQETSKLRKQIERQNDQIMSNEKLYVQIENEKQQYRNEIEALKSKLRETSSKRESRITSLEKERDQSKQQLQELNKTLTNLQNELQASQGQSTKDKAKYDQKIQEYKRMYNDLVRESEQKEQTLKTQVQQYAKEKETEHQNLQAQLRTAQQNISNLQETERVLKLQANDAIQQLLSQYAALATNNSAIMSELNIEQNTSEMLFTTLEDLRKKKDLLQVDLAEFQERYQKDAKTAKQYIGGMQKEIAELTRTNNQLKGMIQNIHESAEARNRAMMIEAPTTQNQDSSLSALSTVTGYSSGLVETQRKRARVENLFDAPPSTPARLLLPSNTGSVANFDVQSPSQGVVALFQPNQLAIQGNQAMTYEEKQIEHQRSMRQQGINNSIMMGLQEFVKVATSKTRISTDLGLLYENTKIESLSDQMAQVTTPGGMDFMKTRRNLYPNAVRNTSQGEGQKNLGMTVYNYVDEVKNLRKLAREVQQNFGNVSEAQVEQQIEQNQPIDFTDQELSANKPPSKKNVDKKYVEKVWVFRKWQKDQSRFLDFFEDEFLSRHGAEQRQEYEQSFKEVRERMRSEKLVTVFNQMGLAPDNQSLTGYRIGVV